MPTIQSTGTAFRGPVIFSLGKNRELYMEDNTNYQLSTSVSDGIVEVIVIGEITDKTLDRLRTEVITIIREKNAKALLCRPPCPEGT